MSIYEIDQEHAAAVVRKLLNHGCTPSYLRDEARELEDAGLIRFDLAFGSGWRLTEKGRAWLSAREWNT